MGEEGRAAWGVYARRLCQTSWATFFLRLGMYVMTAHYSCWPYPWGCVWAIDFYFSKPLLSVLLDSGIGHHCALPCDRREPLKPILLAPVMSIHSWWYSRCGLPSPRQCIDGKLWPSLPPLILSVYVVVMGSLQAGRVGESISWKRQTKPE